MSQSQSTESNPDGPIDWWGTAIAGLTLVGIIAAFVIINPWITALKNGIPPF